MMRGREQIIRKPGREKTGNPVFSTCIVPSEKKIFTREAMGFLSEGL